MKLIHLVISAVLLLPVAHAQDRAGDSIRTLLADIRRSPLDTAQLRKLRLLGADLRSNGDVLAHEVLLEAFRKSLQLGDPDEASSCARELGIWYSDKRMLDSALVLFRESLYHASRNKHLYLMAGANMSIGNIKYWKGEYDSCLHYYLKTAAILEEPSVLADTKLTPSRRDSKLADLYSNISTVFNTLKNLPKADEYIDRSIALAEANKDSIGIPYFQQVKADNYFENGDTLKALRTRLAFLPPMEKGLGEKTYLQLAYQNIAQEYFELGQNDSSAYFCKKSLDLATTLGKKEGIAAATWQLGRIALREHRLPEAEHYFALCRDNIIGNEDPTARRGYFEEMHKLKAAEGDHRAAYDYLLRYVSVADSVMQKQRLDQVNELEAKYQSVRKDAQIRAQQDELKQGRLFILLVSGASVALLAILFLAYRTFRQRRKLQQRRIAELEIEKQLLATEAVLKGEQQERTRIARDLHDGLGGMLSGIKFILNNMKGNLIMTPENAMAFERSMDMLDNSIREMRRVAHNMMPENLLVHGLDRALRDLASEMNGTGGLEVIYESTGMEAFSPDRSFSLSVYRIIQELMSNVLKHAFASRLLVQLFLDGHHLVVNVEDDGKGFDPATADRGHGMGLGNIRDRVGYLKGKFDLHSTPGKGTIVTLELDVA